MLSSTPDKKLRKEWLKQRFLSYGYHEILLDYHDQWRNQMAAHWQKPQMIEKYPQEARAMKTVLTNLSKVDGPGVIPRQGWKDGNRSGWASTINYNISKGVNELINDECLGMSKDQIAEHRRLQEKVLRMAVNIRRTSDDTWEKSDPDVILDEENTGPIDWPSNWRTQMIGIQTQPTSRDVPRSVAAGQPCPRTGWWFTPAAKTNARRYFNKGDVFPAIENSDYGATFWQWSPDQSAPTL